MEELIKYIITNLVDDPNGVSVARDGNTVTVSVPKAEMGKVIGRQGKIAKSLRTIVKAACRDDERINLDIVEIG